jgi:hypothetical protein
MGATVSPLGSSLNVRGLASDGDADELPAGRGLDEREPEIHRHDVAQLTGDPGAEDLVVLEVGDQGADRVDVPAGDAVRGSLDRVQPRPEVRAKLVQLSARLRGLGTRWQPERVEPADQARGGGDRVVDAGPRAEAEVETRTVVLDLLLPGEDVRARGRGPLLVGCGPLGGERGLVARRRPPGAVRKGILTAPVATATMAAVATTPTVTTTRATRRPTGSSLTSPRRRIQSGCAAR